MSCARSESFLQWDRNGAIPLTDNVGAGSCMPRGSRQPLLKTQETDWSQFGDSHAGLSERDIFVQHLVGRTRGDHVAIDHPPVRHPTTCQAEYRLSNVECECCEIDEVSHI
jgi:hypothetical protein